MSSKILLMLLLTMMSIAIIWLPESSQSTDSDPKIVESNALEASSTVADDTEVLKTEPRGHSGYRVYIDPKSGEFKRYPSQSGDLAITPQLQNALSTSSEGLVEVNSPVPSGGVMVHLDNRFQDALVAGRDASGKLVAPCVNNATPANPDHHEPHSTNPLDKGKEE